jgi:hypothetical protein
MSRTRQIIEASARAARRAGSWTTAASLAGWLLEQASGDATRAMYVDAPVTEVQLARARDLLHLVVGEESARAVAS